MATDAPLAEEKASEQLSTALAPRDERGWSVEALGCRVMLYADMHGSARRRQQRGWAAAYEHIRTHNDIVTNAVHEARTLANASECRIVKYVGDGVLAAFAREETHVALDAAKRIMVGLREWSKEKGEDAIHTRVGIAMGDVAVVRYDSEAPADVQGKPIDIAARLISDVARPDQILVDAATKQAVAEHALNGASLVENPRGPLPIEGEHDPIAVFELVLSSGQGQEIQNRRRLARELASLIQPTTEARVKAWGLREAVRALFNEPKPEMADSVDAELERLGGEQLGGDDHLGHEDERTQDGREDGTGESPIERLQASWAKTSEAKKYDATRKAYEKLQTELKDFGTEWHARRDSLHWAGEDDLREATPVKKRADAIYYASGDLGRAITRSLRTLLRDL